MAMKSLRVSPEKLEKVKRAFECTGLTQHEFASEVDLSTRQPIGNFLAGKPVKHQVFKEICFKLNLNWQDIAYLVNSTEPNKKVQSNTQTINVETTQQQEQQNISNIEILVQGIRANYYEMIQQQCGTMRVLDMSHPINLSEIYTNVNILDKITGHRSLAMTDLVHQCVPKNFDRFGISRVTEKRILGIEAVEKYSKLIVLGKPGAGKTTFLKYLAIQCSQGKFQAHRVPIFITLKDFAEAKNQPDLLIYISQKFISYKVSLEELLQIFSNGRAIILLDGLDEIKEIDNDRILKEIIKFTEDFQGNQFVITCRIAAQEYTFDKFTEVEVADFDAQQIIIFATKWFEAQESINTDEFLKKLQENEPIHELATNPLLLTLLCLEFEESLDFPANRSELYNRALKVLLSKWDAKRGIKRDQNYKKLSIQRKEDLLSNIALINFEKGDYFFKQKTLEKIIYEYIYNLYDSGESIESLQIDSEAILKSIEAQHGLLVERARAIYSFSHLTFQEYFAARKIIASFDVQSLKILVNNITEPRWREVFLLSVGMLQNSDELIKLMKYKIDEIISQDLELQNFLKWVKIKSLSVNIFYKRSAVRAFYFGCELHDLFTTLNKALNVACIIDINLDLKSNIYFQYLEEFTSGLICSLDCNIELDYRLTEALVLGQKIISENYDYYFENDIEEEDLRWSISKYNYQQNNQTTYLGRNYANIYNEHEDKEILEDDVEECLWFYNCYFLNEVDKLDKKLVFNLPLSNIYYRDFLASLQKIKNQLPSILELYPEMSTYDFDNYEEEYYVKLYQWIENNGINWIEQLKNIINKHRNIAKNWSFSTEQKKLLQQYYYSNKLLLECLNSDCYISRNIREKIEDELFLPYDEIQY